jgi:cell division protein ZapA (FtsZ GTPase activity inhibitor)
MSEKIKLTVGGIDYYISVDGDREYFEAIAAELDEKVVGMTRANPYLSTTMVGTLVAMEYADLYKRAQQEGEQLKEALKTAEADRARAELDSQSARREIERLVAENTKLRTAASGR